MNNYENRKIEYDKVSNPVELMSFMDKNISYGIYGVDNREYTNWENDINSEFQQATMTKYALCDKERMLKYGLGVCFDQVEFERFWFSEHNYNFKTFFIWFCFQKNNNYCSHTYLVYEDNNKYYYFEHADGNNKGIREFDSYEDAIKYQMDKHIEFHKNMGLPMDDSVMNRIQVFEYEHPKYGCSMDDFYDSILGSKIIYENKSYKEKIK